MKLSKISIVFLLVFACAAGPVFAGGQREPSGAGPVQSASDSPDWLVENTDERVTVIDGYGNKVTVDKPVESVISQGMGAFFSAVKALRAEKMVIASNEYVSRNTEFYPVISKLPSISTCDAVDNEMVIAMGPDLIHMSAPMWTELFSGAVLSEVPVLMLKMDSVRDYRILGAVLGRDAEAEEFVEWVNSYTDMVDERIAGLSEDDYQEVFVYYGGSYGQSAPPPYGTFGKDNTLRNELIKRAGGRSLSRDIPGDWVTVDPEWVIENSPEMIIRFCYIINDSPELGYSVTDVSSAKKLMNSILTKQPAFEGCDAVVSGKVYMLYGDIVQDSWFIGLVYLAKWFHPDLFEDIDPVKMHQEYITRFQRLDYDVATQGLFTYSAE